MRALPAVLEPKAAVLPALVAEAERSGGFDMDVMTAFYRCAAGSGWRGRHV